MLDLDDLVARAVDDERQTRIAGSTWPTSVPQVIRSTARAAPGLAARRRLFAHHS
jgi:hypothetical protein